MPSLTMFLIIILTAIIGNAICFGIQPNGNYTWGQSGNSNKNSPLTGPQWNQNSKSTTTTPWPALGQRRNQQQNPAQSTTTKTPMWVRQDGAPNWVRNTPTPAKITASNTNTNFLNKERGVIPNNQNGQNSNSRRGGTNNRVTNAGQLVGGGGNGNNNGKDASTGSMISNSGTANQNERGGSSQPNENGDVQDYELREFSEELLSKDTNNAAKYVTVNVQGMTSSRSTKDEAPLPLLSIDSKAYSISSIEKLMLLYNNYILKATENEVYTAQEKIEENDLLDTILSTSVMQHAKNFLINKGKLGKDPKEFKDLLRSIWFGMYSRGKGRIGSSGFEHVFLAELKNGEVSGLHNWLYFNEEESNNRANYLGYMRKIDLGTKGSILKYHFTFHDVDKPVGSMFIGTSPELEMALYSTCFILRADKICPLKMNGHKFIIRTFSYKYRGKKMIGSAFPEI